MKTKSGFTLIEILIVISVIAILASIAATAFFNQQRQVRDAKRATDLVSITESFDDYYHETGNFPITCGVSLMIQLACNGSAINSTYPSFQPFTITPTTQLEALKIGLPKVTDSFGNPKAKKDDPPINHTISNSIATSSYFVLSTDMLPNQPSSVMANISFYSDNSNSSSFTCSFTLTGNQSGQPTTKPHRYVLGYFSELDSEWKFFMSPDRADVNSLQFTSATDPQRCATQSTGELKLLSSS